MANLADCRDEMECPVISKIDISHIYEDVKCAYLDESIDYPWIVGFSGGKDSTLVVHILFDVLLSIPPKKRTRDVHIVSNDTLVESPLVVNHMHKTLNEIKDAAVNLSLPISTTITKPDPAQSFWSLLIGKGYPSPNLNMRWCTDRLKIKPTSKFVMKNVKRSGSVVILLGVRKDESSTRKRSIHKYDSNTRFSPHSSLNGAFIYSPIVNLSTEDVWRFLWLNDPAWGGTHEQLISIYKEADSGECPLVFSKEEAPGCGTNSSRFGCWVCTVVQKDKSLQAVVNSGQDKYLPLLKFRDWLLEIRNNPKWRQAKRRNGRLTFNSNGNHIPGPFTIKARKMILEKLLGTQEEYGQQLISNDELNIIHSYWSDDLSKDK